MDSSLDRLFLNVSADSLSQHAKRIVTCLGKLTYDQIWTRGTENENAIGNLVLHLCGNMRQWIVSGVGGPPDVRVRDAEFAARGGLKPGELRERLEETVRQAVAVVRELPVARLKERVTIQSHDVTLLEAIYHVVEHFAQHTGQVIYATKLLTGEDLGLYRPVSAGTEPRP
jgi:uncharacterized damage-inducible protein DinB